MTWRDLPRTTAPDVTYTATADRRYDRALVWSPSSGGSPMLSLSAGVARQLAADLVRAAGELEADTSSKRVERALAAMEAEKAAT